MGKLTADDRAEIVELFAKYAWAGDVGRIDDYVALFTDDGIFDGVSGYYDGPADLAKLANEMKDGPRSRGIQHWVSNSVFEGDDQQAVVKSMCFAPRRIENEHAIVFVGYYVDTVVKVDGTWKFKIRRWRPWSGAVTTGAEPWVNNDDDGGAIHRSPDAAPARVRP